MNNPITLYRIALGIACIAISWLWFHPRTDVVYEADKRVLEENKRLQEQIMTIQHERDILRVSRSQVKEMIVYRYKKLKEDEKVIHDASLPELDSIIRTGF